jgi:hypothetical protein
MAYDVGEEVRLLLEHLHRIGGDRTEITFGELFEDEEVTQTFESLVGTLKAAKKRNQVDFKGHLLMYPVHKDTVITIKDNDKNKDSLPLPANVTILPKSESQFKSSRPAQTTSNPAITKVNTTTPSIGSGLSLPADIATKRSQFESERTSFENKIKDEWSESQINAYLQAKLDAEIEFFKKYTEIPITKAPSVRNSSTTIANPNTNPPKSVTPAPTPIIPTPTPVPDAKSAESEDEWSNDKKEDDALDVTAPNNPTVVAHVEPQPEPTVVKEPAVVKKPVTQPEPAVVKKPVTQPATQPVTQPVTQASKVKPSASPSTVQVAAAAASNDSSQDMIKIVRTIMNQVYSKMKAGFQSDNSYESDYILSIVKDTIVSTTNELPQDPSTPKLKKIMNSVFVSLKNKFSAGTFTGEQILNILKETIVSTTNDLMVESSNPESTSTPTPSQPVSQPVSQPESTTASKPAAKPANQPVSKFSYASNTAASKPAAKPAEPPVNSTAANKPVNSSTPVQKPAQSQPKPAAQPAQQPEPKKPVETPKPQPQPQPQHSPENPKPVLSKPKPAATERPAEDEGNTSKGVESMRADAQARINLTPKAKDADLTDPEILSTYVKMRDDQDPLSWMILGYNNAVSPDKLVVLESGEGGFDEFVNALPSEKPVYMYLNYRFGDTGRPRFIFMSYTPEAFNGLQKARVMGHRGAVETFIKYYQISWHCLSIEEITEAELNKKLRSAGGADYSVQETNKGNFSSYKKIYERILRRNG